MANERGIRCREAARDRPRRAPNERRIERRILLEHFLNLLGGEDKGLRPLNGTSARAVR